MKGLVSGLYTLLAVCPARNFHIFDSLRGRGRDGVRELVLEGTEAVWGEGDGARGGGAGI